MRLSRIIKAFFMIIAPALCNNVFKAACSERINTLRPSNPLIYPFVAALVTLSLRDLNDGRLSKKRCLTALACFVSPPRIVDNFLSPAPKQRA